MTLTKCGRMNDRFKFRCFSKKTKKMYEVDSLHLDSKNEWVWVHYYNPIYDKDLKIQIETPNAVIMQSTGLKDKNGTLIYEGDIVKEHYHNTKETAIKKVFFDKNVIGFAYTDGIEYNQLSITDGYRLQVIGNIYENKELLGDNNGNSI